MAVRMEGKGFVVGGTIVCERPSSGIAGWRGGWIAGIGSEGTRPALLPAGPVPERWNVGLVFIETTHGPAIGCTGLFAYIHSLSDGAWNDACARAALCKVDGWFIFLKYLFSGGRWQAQGWENRKSFHAAPPEYYCCGRKLGGPAWRS